METNLEGLRRLIEILDDQIAHELRSADRNLERRIAPLYSKALSVALAIGANG